MEAAAAVAATRGVSLPMMPPSRKEWRVVSDNPVRNPSNEDFDRSKLGQSDERLIYEVRKGSEPADVDFCSITIDGSFDNDILQQRLHTIVKQKEELQQMEVDLRAQLIARSEIMEMQTTYDSQLKEHANVNVKLQEQLHEKEQTLRELERQMEEKERELHAIRIDNEAAWAKEDLLREQNKELANYRRERDNSEAERAQHLKQIHEFQEHIQEKERQFMELQEQNRVAQETIIFKDEQLREAQAWITRVQEMDVLQSSTNHNLQAELRERTEQYNQLWLGCQRQFADMERLHLHIQQLQLELADARERSGTYSEEPRTSQTNSKDVSHFGQSNGTQIDINASSPHGGSSGVTVNGNSETATTFVSTGNPSTQTENVPSVPMPQSLLGMPTFLPSGQVTALHPFVVHQQGLPPQSVPSHVPQSHVSHFHSVPTISALQHWQNQQAASEGLQMPNHNQYASQTEQNLPRSDTNYDYEVSMNGQAVHSDYLDARSMVPLSNEEGQVLESMDKGYSTISQPQPSLSQISSQFTDALRLEPLQRNTETEEKNVGTLVNHGVESQNLMMEQANSTANASESSKLSVNFSKASIATGAVMTEVLVSTGQKGTALLGKTTEITLLEEGSLLACIVRTIPPGGRIRISSTLPNRLGKMLVPLHWHDYKKKYGKLEEFVASHPELFVIEGDYIQLREGAQEIIASASALAKVAAAAAATSSYSSKLPSVAVTPMAQSNRLKKAPSIDSNSGNANGVCFNVAGGVSSVKILSKSKGHVDHTDSEARLGNGVNPDKSDLVSSQNKRTNANFSLKHQGRTNMTSSSSRR